MRSVPVFIILLLAACRPDTGKPVEATFLSGGMARSYILYIPKGLPEGAPLVLVFHGYTDSARAFMNYTGLNDIAGKYGFAVCYPQGMKDQTGNTFWQVGYSFHRDLKVDDVGFISELTRYLQKKYGFDKNRTFAAGMSNGADMCVLLACREPDLFRAVAPVAGCMMGVNYAACASTRAIPVFMINGTADSTTWWNGDMADRQHYGVYLPTLETFKFFADKNKCTAFSVDTLSDTYPADSSLVIATRYTGGTDGNQVWLYTVVNGGHDWVGRSGNKDINAGEEALKFFQQF
jgi:polyhydroxybutyrate depolymerase